MGILGADYSEAAIGKQPKDRPGLTANVGRRITSLAGLLGFGDPDGTKATAASERSRHAVPLTAERRARHYARQGGTTLTPAQRRRLRKKLNRNAGPLEFEQVAG